MTVKGKHIKAPKAPCPICGKVMTKPGLVGHMAWKHGKDSKAPLLDVPKPMQYQEAKRKAELWEAGTKRDEAIFAAVSELEKAHDAGETRLALTTHVVRVVAHLADSLNVDTDKAADLVYREVDAHCKKKITAVDISFLFAKPKSSLTDTGSDN